MIALIAACVSVVEGDIAGEDSPDGTAAGGTCDHLSRQPTVPARCRRTGDDDRMPILSAVISFDQISFSSRETVVFREEINSV